MITKLKLFNRIKLRLRANKYKNKNDRGGISYVLTQIKSGDMVFDIGCHKAGYLYHMLKKTGKSGEIHAFEPQFNLFKDLIELKNSLKWTNVYISNLALSNISEKVMLHIPIKGSKTDSPGASLLNVFDENQLILNQEIETDTLDKYCDRLNLKPTFLKIDVEGNELEVLKGGINTLKKNKPKILIESEERHVGQEKVREVFSYLENLGYQGKFIKDKEYLPLKEFNFNQHQTLGLKPYCNNFIFE
ncbi:MAG: FkbM family methyltransferase [Sphingobacteriales bacterium]|nr:FkbM family methyltransferase [Sphingobacteriales bacterium]